MNDMCEYRYDNYNSYQCTARAQWQIEGPREDCVEVRLACTIHLGVCCNKFFNTFGYDPLIVHTLSVPTT